ncbi:hypothetical protein CWR43_02830 [Rhizobium sullae]|uniref:Uncharacterized protein n=1 Tax=Rhizobium sullae TaxID=50338 RepID=A0A2N0DFB3_RHISU|nr:hypothetical protein CWR43_02830 [Rhizobium sullae]
MGETSADCAERRAYSRSRRLAPPAFQFGSAALKIGAVVARRDRSVADAPSRAVDPHEHGLDRIEHA